MARRSSRVRRIRSGVPQTAACMKAETIPSMPISRAIADLLRVGVVPPHGAEVWAQQLVVVEVALHELPHVLAGRLLRAVHGGRAHAEVGQATSRFSHTVGSDVALGASAPRQ